MGLTDSDREGLRSLIPQGGGMVPATPASCSTILSYVFDKPDTSQLLHVDEEINYQQLGCHIKQHVAHIRGTADGDKASASAAALDSQSTGRLGPSVVAIDRASVTGRFSFSTDRLTIESLGNFSSCRANVAVYKGKWMYECTVLTPGIQQIGWATLRCPFTSEEGVGDAPDSYAVDGKRQRKWSVKPQPYGEAWVQGDVMGCALDLDAGTLTFYRNGQSLGVAYDRVRTMQPSLAYFPAVSLSHAERCTLNFGKRPFIYPVAGYQPLQEAPSTADITTAEYYCSCLGRLLRLAAHQGAASDSVTASSTQQAKAVDEMQQGIAAVAGTPASPSAAVAAAAAGRYGLSWPGSSYVPHAALDTGSLCPNLAGAALCSADALLLAATLLEPLQELLIGQPYLIHSALLPLLGELQREGESTAGQQAALQLLLQFLLLVWDQGDFSTVMIAVLEELAYRCQVSPLLAQDFPNTAGYPFLALAVSLLQHPAVARLFVSHPDFTNMLEGLLARKSPSPKDLQVLLPHVWWKGCKDETASEERLKASVSIITTTLAKVEQCQYELLQLLLAVPFHQQNSTSSSSDSSAAADCALLVFLRFLLQKNRSALRDVPPPGLSEPTVLMSVFFALLRLLQPALRAAQESGTGPLAAFPAAELLTGADASAEASPVFDVPRLGGIVSHLAREHPISDVERQPVHLLSAHPQQQAPGSYCYVAPAALRDVWVPELLNSCLLLYAWRVGFSYKMIHSLSSSVASAGTTLEELDRMIAASSEAADMQQASSWLLGTRKVYRDELTRDVRLLTLLRTAFFSPAKQQASGLLSSYLATLLANVAAIPSTGTRQSSSAAAAVGQSSDISTAHDAVSNSRASADKQSHLSNLLRYIPVVYAEVVTDYLTALRRLDEQQQQPDSSSECQATGSSSYVTWMCSCLNDPRIANPDVQESLIQVVGLLVDHPGWRGVLESRPAQAQQLLAALLVTFDSRLWHPASSVLLKVIKDCGFGHKEPSEWSCNSLQHMVRQLLEVPSTTDAAFATDVADATAAAAARTRGFLNKLFNTLNWTLTEFTVCVGDLHNLQGRRSILEAQNQYRRTGLMFELSVNFMRILEFVVPTTSFISNSVNRTRLRELLQFVLSHFTNGPDARRLNELLQANQAAAPAASSSGNGAATAAPAAAAGDAHQQAAAVLASAPLPGAPPSLAAVVPAYAASAMRFESNSLSERVQKPLLLAPVMGILLALWDAHQAATPAAEAADGTISTDVLGELAEMADERFMSALQFLQDVDWSAAFPSSPLSAALRAFGQLLVALAAARAEHESAAAAQVLPADVPEEFLDPITMELMKDPVQLPDSQVVVDRSTIERHLLSSETDPFSRAALKPEQLLPAVELKARMQHWLMQLQTGARTAMKTEDD